MKKRNKKWVWTSAIVLVLVAAIAVTMVLFQKKQKPVYVFGFQDGIVGMTDYYDGGSENGGMVEVDRFQPVHLTKTQTVLEIRVTEGQQVKKGDVLFTYDTTLSDIALQQKDLSIQQTRLDLDTAKRELDVINSYVPISYHPVEPPKPTEPEEPVKNLADFNLEGKDYLAYSGSGKTSLTPKYCWLRSGTMIDEKLMEDLFSGSEEKVLYVLFQFTEKDSNNGAITEEHGIKLMRLENGTKPETSRTAVYEATDLPEESVPEETTTDETKPDETVPEETTPEETKPDETVPEETLPEETKKYSYRYAFFDSNAKDDGPDTPPDDGIDMNSGYTSEQIATMRVEKQEQIKELEFQIKVAESEYSIMQKEAASGEVVAQFDGVVMDLTDPETAAVEGQPLMKVSGGGGFYVTGLVSELDLGSVQIGQTVFVRSWDTMETYEGTVVELSEFPQQSDEFMFGQNQNNSYYPYKIFVDESANLRDGEYVAMTLQANENQSSLYVDNAFLLTEGPANYVYVKGEDGRLEKRQVKVGGTLWGSYTEVRGGITAEDWLAFPYGKNIREGTPAQEGSWENLPSNAGGM